MGKFIKVVTAVLLSISLTTKASSAASGAVGEFNIKPENNLYSYALPHSSDHLSDPSYTAAIKFVRSSGLHKSLSLLLLDSVKSNRLVENAINKYGFEAVKNKVVMSIKSTTTDFRNDWDGLLAKIYSSQFDAHVLQSIADQGENSPYFTDFIIRQKQLTTSDRLHASNIFKAAHSKVLKTLQQSFSA